MSSLKRKVSNTAIVVLAAGNSSRLGQSKQLVKIHGQTLLNRTIDMAEKSLMDSTYVILGDKAHVQMRSLTASADVKIAVNEAWEWGMGNSLRFGIQNALLEEPDLSAMIISVCDQPFLDSSIFNNLLTLYQSNPGKIVASKYENDAFGVPVLFPKFYFDALLLCDDRAGAKSIVNQHLTNVIFSPFEKGMIDVDTPDDLARLS